MAFLYSRYFSQKNKSELSNLIQILGKKKPPRFRNLSGFFQSKKSEEIRFLEEIGFLTWLDQEIRFFGKSDFSNL